jgi:hypothetical protein
MFDSAKNLSLYDAKKSYNSFGWSPTWQACDPIKAHDMKERSHSKTANAVIKGARGALKGKRDDKPFSQRWADYKKEEKALEEARYARLRPR